MINRKIFISIIVFSILFFFTSIVKNKTRIIEKSILNNEKKIAFLKNEIYETQLDFFYLSSPDKLTEKIDFLSTEDYSHLSFSQIYLSYESFLKQKKQLTRKINEKDKK